jgi:hypothetical protein
MLRGSSGAIAGVALASLVAGSSPAFGKPFEISPPQYEMLANRALMQVGADLRFTLRSCGKDDNLECRFTSEHVTALVRGQAQPPRIDRIVLEADLLRDEAGADPATILTDVVLALGATVVVVDPRLPAEQRVELLSDLTNTAIDRGQSEATGMDAKYAAIFDDAAGGLIRITVVPAE